MKFFLAFIFLFFISFSLAFTCVPIYKNGNENNNINLVFLGEGYSDEETNVLGKKLIDNIFLLNGVKPFSERFYNFNFFVLTGAEDYEISCPAGDKCYAGGRWEESCRNKFRKLVYEACPFADIIVVLTKDEFYTPFTSGIRGNLVMLSFPYMEKSVEAIKEEYPSLIPPSKNSIAYFIFLHELGHVFGLYDEYAIEGTAPVSGCPVNTAFGDKGAGFPNCQDEGSILTGFWWNSFVGTGFGGNKILTSEEQAIMRKNRKVTLSFDEALNCLFSRNCPDYSNFLSWAGLGEPYCLKDKKNYRPSPSSIMNPHVFTAYAFERPSLVEGKINLFGAYNSYFIEKEISSRLSRKIKEKESSTTDLVPSEWQKGVETLELKKGYNLVNIPFKFVSEITSKGCSSNELNSSGLVWAYYDNALNKWTETNTIRGGLGYLVYSKKSCTVDIAGDFYYGSIHLKKGWNLAAFPLAKEFKGDCIFKSVKKLKSGFSSIEYVDVPFNDIYGSDLDMDIREAYWLYVEHDCVLYPSVYPWE